MRARRLQQAHASGAGLSPAGPVDGLAWQGRAALTTRREIWRRSFGAALSVARVGTHLIADGAPASGLRAVWVLGAPHPRPRAWEETPSRSYSMDRALITTRGGAAQGSPIHRTRPHSGGCARSCAASRSTPAKPYSRAVASACSSIARARSRSPGWLRRKSIFAQSTRVTASK